MQLLERIKTTLHDSDDELSLEGYTIAEILEEGIIELKQELLSQITTLTERVHNLEDILEHQP